MKAPDIQAVRIDLMRIEGEVVVLAEQRAELLEALRDLLEHAARESAGYPQSAEAWFAVRDAARAAIARATEGERKRLSIDTCRHEHGIQRTGAGYGYVCNDCGSCRADVRDLGIARERARAEGRE